MGKKKTGYRQGDVLMFRQTGKVPTGGKKVENQVLAYGEVTGHKHQITAGEVDLWEYEGDPDKYLRVKSETATLTHEEHGTVTIDKGIYRVKIQREYDPAGWAYVSD